jgi:PAS domain S-box-containing protein
MAVIDAVNQSEDGTIWIGTDGAGLVRFDGTSFEELSLSSDDNAHHITHLSVSEEKVFFSSRYKGFFEYDPQKDSLRMLDIGNFKIGEKLSVFKFKSNYYLFGTRGILLINESGVSSLRTLKGNEADLEITQYVQTNHALYFLSNQGNFRIEDGKMIAIHKWLNLPASTFNGMKYGYYDGEKIAFFDETGSDWLEVVINDRGGFYSINQSTSPIQIKAGDRIVSCTYNRFSHKGGVLTEQNQLYELKNKSFRFIAKNYKETLMGCTHIFADYNGDFWVCSSLKGIYKVSLEPFTKLQLHPVYDIPTIATTYRKADGTILVSTYEDQTYLSNIYKDSEFNPYNFGVNCIQSIGGTTYLGTEDGIRILENPQGEDFEIRFFKDETITFMLADGYHLWVGLPGRRLYRINTQTNHIQAFRASGVEMPDYFYTGQIGQRGKVVYFGTNLGVYQFNRKTRKLTKIHTNNYGIGSYSGVSTRDKFGTCWFTLDRGLMGITARGKVVRISGNDYFKSTLFYTINHDRFGNLVLGTNKGLTFLKVNKEGEVIHRRHYDDESGFFGYETNMRSQFQIDNSIFLGTVEGLFLVNTAMLEQQRTPIRPVIRSRRHLYEEDNISFQVKVNNAKTGNIRYIYRVPGFQNQWTRLEEGSDEIRLEKLHNGNFTLEVKATYDGVHFSEVASYPFEIDLPIWKSNWFVLLLMALVVLINLLLINLYKSLDSGKLLNTKDIVVHLRLTPTILLFAALTAPTAQIVAPLLVPELQMSLGRSLSMYFALLLLYFLSLAAKANRKEHLYDVYLKSGLFIVAGNYLWETYASALHPYYIIGMVLIGMIVPYILSKVKTTVIFSIVVLVISICYVSILNTTVYPKSYFLIAMFMLACLMVFVSYIRYDSLEKLIFISSIINRGNIPAVAFNKEGKVTYASENISNFAQITHNEIIGANISVLNDFIPFGDQFKEKDITREFRDGETYLVPMENGDGKVRWIEWAYKDFTKQIKVILGQDVSEKMELENTYELLVQNAEDFIYRCDIDGNFVFLNDICYTKLGYTKKELVGRHSDSIVPETYREEISTYYQNHFENKLNSSYREFPIQRKDGDIIWVGQHFTTLFSAGSDSHVIGYIALARDITELRSQQQLIQDQRDAITASINYARRIQYNLLPQENEFEKNFHEHFIISKPKDIVSGDFYWMQRVRNSVVLVVADCTGHGVPGSFMTLLGYNILNSIVLENGTVDPGMILNDLDKKLIEYLPRGKGKTAVNDGMEVTVVVFDDRNPEQIAFACAGSRFLVYEKNEFTMFKGDNKHICDTEDHFEAYRSHFARFSTHFTLFLFTDGFQDQFGGPNDKKYSFRRLLELFEANINLPLQEQRKMIDDNFNKWIGSNSQTDDVSIIAVKRKLDEE